MTYTSIRKLDINSAEYKMLCKPVVSLSIGFIAVAAFGILYGFSAFMSLFNPIIESQALGYELFGIYGAAIAGQSYVEQTWAQHEINSALVDVENYSVLLFFYSLILGVVIAVLSGLSIARTKGKNKFGIKTLSAFYFVSGIAITVIVNVFMNLLLAKTASEHYSEPNYLVPDIILSVVLIGALIFYFFKSYHQALDRFVEVQPIRTNYGANNTIQNTPTPTMPLRESDRQETNKPTKSCPFCGETILAVAVKCKHCGEWLPKEEEKKMEECPICGEKVEAGLETCPYCNENTHPASSLPKETLQEGGCKKLVSPSFLSNRKWGLAGMIIFGIIILGIIIFSFYNSSENTSSIETSDQYEEVHHNDEVDFENDL